MGWAIMEVQMLRLLSQQQALSLRGTIPELALIRSLQFQGEGYDPDIHGVILVLEPGDDLCRIPEIGPEGLYDEDGLPNFEFVECFIEGNQLIYEVLIIIDDSKIVALVIIDDPDLDSSLRTILRHAAGAPQPLPQPDLRERLEEHLI
jgi:hypothetical protein